MALATKPSLQRQRRVWKAPTTKAWWIWLVVSLLLYGIVYAVYLVAIKTQSFPGPFNDPLRSFGILSFLLVLSTAAYSLRRRFARGLPGMARDWLWMHTWIGITALLIAGIVPADRICVTSRAVLEFHTAWDPTPSGGQTVNTEGNEILWSHYPENIRRWISRHGGLREHVIFLRGAELSAMYPACNR